MERALCVGGLAALCLTCARSVGAQVAPPETVGCDEAIAVQPSARPDWHVVLDRAAFPLPADVQAVDRSGSQLYPYFAKVPIWLRDGGGSIDVIVPRGRRRRLGVVWGTRGAQNPESSVRFPGCGSGNDLWRGYPGGYFVRKPTCVPVILRVGDQKMLVRLSIGRRCRTAR